MSETFLHGVEVVEIDSGPRPIQTVRSSVIGLIGTAPNAAPDTKATLATGAVASNTALTWTAKLAGTLGNAITVALVNPGTNSASLTVSVSGNAITASLATNSSGAITTTATQLAAAIAAKTEANALVGVTNTGASTGAGVVAALASTALSGGVNEPFPLNTPVLVAGSRREAAKLDTVGTGEGTLPQAMDSIFDQIGAVVVVVRVEKETTESATIANVVGGVNATTGEYEGVQCFLGAESKLGVTPRILIAPGFTNQRTSGANAVVSELVGIAERLRAVIVADGPNTTDEAAGAYAGDFGSPRVYMVDPGVTKLDSDGNAVDAWASACVAGVIAKTDNDLGFWWSPSNKTINGITGTKRSVDFALGDSSARANLLNEQGIATIIRQDGYRLWGNRTLSSDPKWMFLSVRRTADIINDSLLRAHLWAVDRNITKTYVKDVTDCVNAYLRHLVSIGAIIGGECWADADLNTPDQIAQGKVYFNFQFTAPYPAEHITFRSQLTQEYLTEIFE